MKLLASVWKVLSVPVLLLAIWLGWWGVKHWSAASAMTRPVTLAELDRQTEGTLFVRDSFDYDLTSPGLRQENHYGFKGPALAVFPVRAPGDTTSTDTTGSKPGEAPKPVLARFAVVSADARFVGPSVNTFLHGDSTATSTIKVSSSDSRHAGNIGPEMKALTQVTAGILGDSALALPQKGRAFIEGIANRRTVDDFPDLANPAPALWEIRTGSPANTTLVIGAFVLALVLIALFFAANLVVRNFDRAEREREDAEREAEPGLV